MRSKCHNFFRVTFLSILLVLTIQKLCAQINPVHTAAVQNEIGVTPYLTFPGDVFVSGQYAYVLDRTTMALEIVDITNPFAPQHKGSLVNGQGGALLSNPASVYVQGNYAYVAADGNNALEIIDVSDPSSPVHTTSITQRPDGSVLAGCYGVQVSGNYAYVINASDNSLDIFDISTPSAPVYKSTLLDGGGSAPFLWFPAAIFVQGGYAFIASHNSKVVEIVDISDPSNPTHKGSFKDGTPGAPATFPTSVNVSGNYAYVVWSYINSSYTDFETIDISNAMVPFHKGSVVSGVGGASFSGNSEIAISGNYAYIGGVNSTTLEVIDITTSTPAHKTFLADGTGGAMLQSPAYLVTFGSYLYVSSGSSNALEVIDVTNPGSPTHKSSLIAGTGGAIIRGPQDVFVSGNYAYVANYIANALQIVDITDPENPVPKGNISDGEGGAKLLRPSSVYVSGNYAYVVCSVGNALEIIDISNPSSPVHRGSLVDGGGAAPFLNAPQSVFVAGDFAYIVGNNTLEIVNVSNPSNPTHKTNFTTNLTGAKSVYVSGNFVYVACNITTTSGALEIINIPDLANPVPAQAGFLQNSLLGGASDVKVSGKYAYVIGYSSNQLVVVDISSLAIKGSLAAGSGGALLSGPMAIDLAGSYAFIVTIGNNAIEIVDIHDPTKNPTHVASLSNGVGGALLFNPHAVIVSGNYAFVTSYSNGALEVIYLWGPKITGVSSSSGSVGSSVTVTGQNFNTLVTANLNGKPAPITAVTSTTMSITVPPGATIGKLSVTAHNSTTNSATNFIVIPTLQAASNISQTGFTASWSDVGATTYYLDISTDNFATYVSGYNNLNVGNTLNFAVVGLLPGTSYQYRVRSYDGAANSGNSNSITTNTLPITPTANAATKVTQSGFTANWTASPGATGYYIDVASDNAFSNFVVGYNSLSVPNSAVTSQVVTGLNPYTSWYFRVRSRAGSGTSISSNVINVVTLDLIPPVITPSPTPNPSAITLGSTPILNTIITDNVTVDSCKLFYRGVSQKYFKNVTMQGAGGTGGNYSITVQTNWYDSLGLEYYFRAVDEAGNTSVSTSNYIQLITPSMAIPALPSGTKQSDYRIVSFPYQLATDNKITTVYSGVPWNDNTKAAMWWWNPGVQSNPGKYDQYGSPNSFETVDQGKGYWVITNTSVTPQLANVPAPKYNRSNLYTMTLKPNWNEIGNPYPVPISWGDVIAFNQKNNVTSFGSLTIYDGTGFKMANNGVLLKPFEGGFVKNLSSSDITIQIPFAGETSIGGRMETIGSDISQDAWNVFLHVSQDDFTNQLGGFGMHPSAKPGPDRYDNFNPPQFMESPEVNFTNSDYPNTSFSNDMVPTQENYHWRFTPDGKSGAPTQLKWTEDLKINSSKPLFLLDEQTLEIIDMKQVNTYQFSLNKGNQFSIFYGADIGQITLPEVVASAPYPNPVSSEGAINLNLPDAGNTYQIILQIFNNKGEQLGSTERTAPSGIQPLKFALSDQVPSGIYLYKLNVSAENIAVSFTGKIIKL